MPGLFDDIPSVVDPNVVEKRSGGLFDDIPAAPVAPAPVATGVLAPNPKDDPVTAQVRAEMAAERVAEAEEEKRRQEQFKAGETSWWDLLRPYPGKFKPLTPEQEKAQEKAEAAQEVMGQGLFGLSDEIAAVAGIPGEMIGRGMMNPITAYNYAKARENIELQEAREKAGGLGTLAELGMGLAAGGGLAKAGLTFVPKVANAGWKANALGRAKDAAVLGAAYGAGTGSGVADRATGAAGGAALGALLGAPSASMTTGAVGGALLGGALGGDLTSAGTGAVGGAVLGPFAARAGGRMIRSMFDPTGVGAEVVGSRLAERGRSLEDVGKGMRRAARDQLGGMWTIADETAPQTRSLMSGVAQAPSSVRDDLYQRFSDRAEGQGERLVFELERLAGDPRTAKQLHAAKDAERRLTNKANFDQSRADAKPVNLKKALDVADEEIYLGPAPGTPQKTESKIATALGGEFDYPPPHRFSSKLYRTAYERDLLRDIERGYANGLTERDIVEALKDRIADVAPGNRVQLVRQVKRTLGIPDPTDQTYSEWQVRTLDRLIAEDEQAAVKGFSGLSKDSIADAVREARAFLSDKGEALDKFEHVWRARQNIAGLIKRVGLNPPVLGQKKQSYNEIGVPLKRVLDAVDESLAESSPTYRKSLEEAARGRRVLEAIERGAQMARKGREQDNIPEYRALGPEEQAGARTGYTSEVAGMIESGTANNQLSKVKTPKRRAELSAFAVDRRRANRFNRARDREKTMVETFGYSFGGSPTARREAEQEAVPELLNPEIISALLTGQPVLAGRNLLTQGKLLGQGLTPEVRDAILQILSARSGKETTDALAQIQQSGIAAEARRQLLAKLLQSSQAGVAAGLTGN